MAYATNDALDNWVIVQNILLHLSPLDIPSAMRVRKVWDSAATGAAVHKHRVQKPNRSLGPQEYLLGGPWDDAPTLYVGGSSFVVHPSLSTSYSIQSWSPAHRSVCFSRYAVHSDDWTFSDVVKKHYATEPPCSAIVMEMCSLSPIVCNVWNPKGVRIGDILATRTKMGDTLRYIDGLSTIAAEDQKLRLRFRLEVVKPVRRVWNEGDKPCDGSGKEESEKQGWDSGDEDGKGSGDGNT